MGSELNTDVVLIFAFTNILAYDVLANLRTPEMTESNYDRVFQMKACILGRILLLCLCYCRASYPIAVGVEKNM